MRLMNAIAGVKTPDPEEFPDNADGDFAFDDKPIDWNFIV